MTAAEALQAAVSLLAAARQASDGGDTHLASLLATEALAWATVAGAIESGVPAPDNPDRQPGGFPATG